MHVRVLAGGDLHHTIEAVFKAFGKALRQAVEGDPRATGIPSTKGVL
jgi:imidazoleglycerol-phosphate dehydratase